jgi:DNA-binding response OmpR family regulator
LAAQPDGILRGKRILVVEDEFLIALDLQRVMEEAGAVAVVFAQNLAEARERCAAPEGFHLVVIDRRLGQEDALPLIGELNALGVPLLVASGLPPEMGTHGIAVIRKPFTDEEVLAAIAGLLGN